MLNPLYQNEIKPIKKDVHTCQCYVGRITQLDNLRIPINNKPSQDGYSQVEKVCLNCVLYTCIYRLIQK